MITIRSVQRVGQQKQKKASQKQDTQKQVKHIKTMEAPIQRFHNFV
jgi:hypothetical protein